ncbi:MAG: Holliday junction resolvase RuvX [Chlamydiota bacterium]
MTSSDKLTRLIGIDYGMARIGLSYSDPSKLIASPLAIVNAEKKAKLTIDKVKKALEKHQEELGYRIEKIIVGLPLMMNGKAGLMVDEVQHFIDLLKEAVPDVPIETWDERLTSVQAERSMREASMSRKKRSKRVDTVSAVIILQNYLDCEQLRGGPLPPIPPVA